MEYKINIIIRHIIGVVTSREAAKDKFVEDNNGKDNVTDKKTLAANAY